MLDDAAAICEAAGGSIADMVRVQLFATDLREVAPARGPCARGPIFVAMPGRSA